MPEDEQELCRLIAEADRLQMLISSYLTQVAHEMEMVRRAATAYTRSGGFE